MLSVSNPALQQLHGAMPDTRYAGKSFRIMPKDESNLTLKFTDVEDSDATFEYGGETVLALPRELIPFCKNKSLDVNDAGQLELA
jgi:hypothetical protein